MYKDDFLQKRLAERSDMNLLRKLPAVHNGWVDFSSNDYLGIATQHLLHPSKGLEHSSKGSRLLAGNYSLIEEAEQLIANFQEADAALIFNSGYDANVGLLSSIANREDTFIFDALSHASIRDGIRLSVAKSFSFQHNNIEDLEKKISKATGNIFIVTETVFSMDGDECPLKEIITIATKYKAHIILDEAHATGVVGDRGEGLAQSLKVHSSIFARVHTFGKACGAHGAVILGSLQLKSFLVNYARSFIYTTALPESSVECIIQSYRLFPSMVAERKQLAAYIQQFQTANLRYKKLNSLSAIQGVIVPGNTPVKELATLLQKNNFDIRPILSPTVPEGSERLRIVLHSFNTQNELDELIRLLSK